MAKKSKKESEIDLAAENWDRYQYGRSVGHDDYIATAQRNDDFYLGGGLQWSEADRKAMTAQKRPMIELNHIMPAVHSAIGMQLHSRVDIDFQPVGEGADEKTAEVLSKVVMQVADQVEYHWKESLQFEDGEIQQRGFLDFRVDFSNNFQGEIACDILDPLDVIPDPDAQGYEPSKWQDVTVIRWLTYSEIEQRYGAKEARSVSQLADAYFEDDNYSDRSHFGDDADGGSGYRGWVEKDKKTKTRRYMVIDRQHWRMEREPVIVYYTGEVKPLEGMTEQQIARALEMGVRSVSDVRKVRWTVTCGKAVLFDDWSPYETFTIIPFFPVFRRGRTRGMVDNLRSPQELENKSVTYSTEILGQVSNAGWDVEEDSLVNMEPEDLEKYGSKNGLVVVYRKNSTQPHKREPSQPPAAANMLADRAEYAIKTVSGMSDAIQGQQGNEVSGVAIQAKQYQGQLQMGRPFDNLALTRRLAARKFLELIQKFYTEERVIRIIDPQTKKLKEEVVINQVDETGNILNDVTIGRYDMAITETQTHATFQSNQFEQMLTLKKEGVPVPDKYLIESSMITKKHEIVDDMAQSAGPPPDPEIQGKIEERAAKVELTKAQAEKVKAEAVNTSVDSQYSAVQTAEVIASVPQAAPLADQLLRSAGDVDKDAPPIVPESNAGPVQPEGFPPNTDPTTPVPVPTPESPAVGAESGIETQRMDGNGGPKR